MKRIVFSERAKADVRAIPQALAINILKAIHCLAESDSGDAKKLQGRNKKLLLMQPEAQPLWVTANTEPAESWFFSGHLRRSA